MSANSPLRRLAADAGIALGYHDIFGRFHEPSDEVLRDLLTALEVLPAINADPEPALEAWLDDRWRETLPPAAVLWRGRPPLLRLVLPGDGLDRRIHWDMAEESGKRHTGDIHIDECRRLGERWVDGVLRVELEWELPLLPLPGYHRLQLAQDGQPLVEIPLIVAPEHCYRPPALEDDRRIWGPAVQLYGLRSERNWGIGDFTDLRRFGEQWAEQGADAIGVNPLHALFLGNPAHASPYSPSSRRFVNPLYLDIEAIADFAECEPARGQVRSVEFQTRLQALRDAELVDYPAAAALKLGVLDRLYRHFREAHLDVPGDARGDAFRAYQHEQGPALRQYALFEALYADRHAADPNAWGWLQWPEEFRSPTSEQVTAFAEANLERIEFIEYLQWQVEQQLSAVADGLTDRGMGVGLYLDLAVSVDRGGADGWRNQGLYSDRVSVGAPPDDFNTQGQNWGLPPFNPLTLRASGYGALVGALRENMSRAGALRIDHVMGLMRLFWIPHGRSAAEGAYVLYPFDDLLGIVTLESHRNRCIVIGEDLGTVPPEVKEGMQRVRMLSYRVLYFEQDEHGFKPPDAYPEVALATVTTHDLPTLAGYWRGHDIALRTELDLFGSEDIRAGAVVGRAQDRSRLLLALEREQLLPEGAGIDPLTVPEMSEELARSIHVYLARSPAKLMMIQPEDVVGEIEQVNLPGSLEDKHPNWRRRLPVNVERWSTHDAFLRLTAALREVRVAAPERVRRKKKAARLPRATYRLQLNNGFTFRDATALVPYLAELGISHVYCSPYLRARAGSQHGYDIIDHNALNPEIGSQEDFDAFCAALDAHRMSQIMDVVPNHMGVMGADNVWWLDVLENGEASLYAPYFDIDWRPAKAELHGRVLLPALGGAYGEVLERGELQLRFERETGSFSVYYYEHRLPIAPESYPELLGARLDTLALKLGEQNPHLVELQSLISALGYVPGRREGDPEKLLERQRDVQLHKQRLARLCAEAPEIAQHIEETVAGYNGDPEDASSFDMLHALLEAQPYRLAHWHAAADEINYRRFFDIHDLAALRMEDSRVFESTHQRVLALVNEGRVEGLRIDHPDGLYDPQGYFERLQAAAADQNGAATGKAAYLVVEKILAPDEPLPEHWPVHGTTGYDFLSLVNGLFVDPAAERDLTRFYRAFSGEGVGFEELVYKAKHMIMKYALSSELNMLAFELNRMSEADRRTRDFTLNRLRHALAEFVAWLPVYRTYERERTIHDRDRHYIEQALDKATRGTRAEEIGVYRFLRSVLMREGLSEDMAARADRFVMRLQQYTGAVMAKGMEDTTFYRYFPLVSLNEVGSEPCRFGVTVERFHQANIERQRQWPHTMLATSSHDNKRSEDVRARLNVISELRREWRGRVRRWAEIAARAKRSVDGSPAPSRNDEYLFYQTVVGAWPLGETDDAARQTLADRVEAYMLKAVREAKHHTSWINPNQPYEEAVSAFVQQLMSDHDFLAELRPFQQRLARFGLYNGLSQTLLKLTAPGVPDVYQGNELWDFSLVDPDNRRPVDYRARQQYLQSLPPLSADTARSLLDTLEDGRAKLWLIRHVLVTRRKHETLFRDGGYMPLAISGERAEHLCAFARQLQGETAIVIAPRFYARLLGEPVQLPLGMDTWFDTRISVDQSAGKAVFTNVLTGAEIAVEEEAGAWFIRARDVLSDFPVALLVQRN